VPELLLVDAAGAGTDPPSDRLSRWASELHDQLESPGRPSAADRRRLTSWLRVQAVGRDTVTVTEARMTTYAELWATAAQAAGLTTRLISAGGESEPPVAAAVVASDGTSALAEVDDRWRTRIRIRLLDHAEAAGRAAVRTIQR